MFKNITYIFNKELKSYLQNRMAWFVFAVYALLSMAVTFFQSRFITSPEPGLISFFKLQADIFTLIIPALTIKLWTDEKRLGTWELTLSLPISYTAITFGKFLAVWVLTGLMLLSTVGLWMSTAALTYVDNPAIFLNYLSCWLICGALCAVSLAASAFTAHPVSAFVASLAVCLGVALLNFTAMFDLDAEVLLRAGNALNFSNHWQNLISGQVSLSSLFYLCSLMFFALWLNVATIMPKHYRFGLFTLCLLVSFAGFNIAVALFGSSAVWDLSPDRRFSLSSETKNWLKQNNQTLFVRLYLSPEVERNEYARDVLRLLEQYQLNSNNKISLHSVEVTPSTPAEAEANKLGLRGGGRQPWFGLVVSDENGRFAVIPYLESGRRNYLEHDISRILSRLGSYQKPTIGIMSPKLPVISSSDALDYATDWPFAAVLRQDYNLRQIPADVAKIPAGTNLLLVVNPKMLSPVVIYAIDQYLMQGGNILIFADPLSEVVLASAGADTNRSNLKDFLQNLGIGYNDLLVAGDNLYNRSVKLGSRTEKYPFWMNIVPGQDAHPLVAGLKPLALNSPGYFSVDEKSPNKPQILFATSADSGEVDVAYLQHASLTETLQNYTIDSQSRPLAVLLEGAFSSLFSRPLAETEQYLPFFSVSLQPGKLMLVSDSDILNSELWNTNRQPAQDSYDFIPTSGNMDFVERAVDYLSDNTAILNTAPKFVPYTAIPLGSNLMLRAEDEYAVASSALSKELADVLLQQANLKQQMKNQELLPSLQVTRQLESLERRRLELQQQIKVNHEAVIDAYKLRLTIFMALNFIMPLLLLGMMIAFLKSHRRRLSRLAERITDV